MTLITYTRPFRDNVKGIIRARFRPDRNGNPLYELDEDDRKVFTIELSLDAPTAQTIDSVAYYMDDPTFSEDPEAVSIDRDNAFAEEITSYGDLEIVVTVQIGTHAFKQRVWLSSLLEVGHQEDMRPSVRQAIDEIANN